MTSSAAPAPPAPPRRATRSAEDALLGGVAAGLATHLGLSVTAVRVFFLVTGLFGFGVLFYAGLWLMLPMDTRGTGPESPGLEAARRQGRRPQRRTSIRDAGALVAVVAIFLGVAGLLQVSVGGGAVWWPALIALVGIAVLWRQADEAQRERWLDTGGRVSIRRVLVGGGGWASWARLAAGLGLLVTALVLFAVQTGRTSVALDVIVAGLIGIVGIALTLGPWLVRLTADLSEERAQRIRSQERADVAAHLHDSVLQTLALIQRNAEDPARVSMLARSQERDLRAWLFTAEPEAGADALSVELRTIAAEVENTYGVAVELVTVGDCDGGAVQPLVQAARESVVNAAQHSGAARIDVYAEVTRNAVEVFVRDRGRGFDAAQVPDGRLGIRHSITDRMERHGGSADLVSTPGGGTEVRLRIPRKEENRA